MEGDTLSVTQSLFTGSGSRCWLPRTTHAMHYPHSGARVPSKPPTTPHNMSDQWQQPNPVGNKGYEV